MSEPDQVLTVTELNTCLKQLLNEVFPEVWLMGEVSGLSRSGSGHVYFSLKDSNSTIGAVMWKTSASRLTFGLADGLEIICRGRIDVYPPQGRYQLVVEEARPCGEGRLQRLFNQLRDKLYREGLFDQSRKRPLPAHIRRIGIVTGTGTAALHDFLEVLRRRWKGLDVLIAPARVQGQDAEKEIAAQIDALNRMADPVDVIVLSRGGGSPEDLWTFNEELLVRAVAASRIPTVSAIGHEVDVTLCDFAADITARTPTEAAELVSPNVTSIRERIQSDAEMLQNAIDTIIAGAQKHLDTLAELVSVTAIEDMLNTGEQQIDLYDEELIRLMEHAVEKSTHDFETCSAVLESLSPLKVFERGYSLTLAPNGTILQNAADVVPGMVITTVLNEGRINSRVIPESGF